ncbi:MAG: hypothetical protein J7494_01985 [Sphingobium sp.]|nr:hypothetical protein [Sphingobium sp.]
MRFDRMWRMSAVLIGMTLPGVSPAATALTIEAGQPYVHGPSKVSVPAVLDGVPRISAATYSEQAGLDEGLQYRGGGDGEIISIYVFRLVLGSPEIWFDRARFGLMNNNKLGQALDAPVEAFTPPGGRVNSALRSVHAVQDSTRFRSTAVAMIPLDGWLVTARFSSATLDPTGLRARMDKVLGGISWPAFDGALAADPVIACAKSLKLDKPAKVVTGGNDMAAALLGAVAVSVRQDEKAGKAPKAPPAHWCRETVLANGSGVYRANNAEDSYVIAVGDSGVGLSVAPGLAGLLGEGKKGWTPNLVLLDRQLVFRDFDRLPQTDQMIELLEKGRPISSATTWPENGNKSISINAK